MERVPQLPGFEATVKNTSVTDVCSYRICLVYHCAALDSGINEERKLKFLEKDLIKTPRTRHGHERGGAVCRVGAGYLARFAVRPDPERDTFGQTNIQS
jgi:hypothetical protein